MKLKTSQIKKHSKDNDVLARVKAAAVNPLEILIMTGSVKPIQNYSKPQILGNECYGHPAYWTDCISRIDLKTQLDSGGIVLITGGPWSFGELAVPIAKAMGLEEESSSLSQTGTFLHSRSRSGQKSTKHGKEYRFMSVRTDGEQHQVHLE